MSSENGHSGIRIGFAGCHEISWFCLKKLCDLSRSSPGVAVVGAFNLPTAAGRKHSAFVEFDALASEYGFPLHLVPSLSSGETLALLRTLCLDILFVIGWHRIVPQEVIDCAPVCLGVHASLLPANRGSSPINWALIRGVREGGMSLFHLTMGVDSGDLVGQVALPLELTDTCRSAYDRATVAALGLLETHWPALCAGRLPRVPQDESRATYNDRRRPDDGAIDWTGTILDLHNWIRALTRPYPGAFTVFRGRRLFVWAASFEVGEPAAPPGTIIGMGDALVVAARDGVLRIHTLGFAGEPDCAASVFQALYSPARFERLG